MIILLCPNDSTASLRQIALNTSLEVNIRVIREESEQAKRYFLPMLYITGSMCLFSFSSNSAC